MIDREREREIEVIKGFCEKITNLAFCEKITNLAFCEKYPIYIAGNIKHDT